MKPYRDDTMEVSVFGAGYVGLVTGLCFAELGYRVTIVEADAHRLKQLQAGSCVIKEPNLESILQRQLKSNKVIFTRDYRAAVARAEIIFIAVGTPSSANGAADLSIVETVACQIADSMESYKLIVTKSTVPVGTAYHLHTVIESVFSRQNKRIPFDVASNPEFLREGCAVADFMSPDRIVIGVDTQRALELLQGLYAPLIAKGVPFLHMDSSSAEFTKYAANTYLANRVSFMNQLSQLAEPMGVDIEKVRLGIGLDKRVGMHYLSPSLGFGGYCLPKDLRAFIYMAKQCGVSAQLLEAVEAINGRQKARIFEKVFAYFGAQLSHKVIAVWGVAFKANTNDIREAPSLGVLEKLWECGAKVQVYDPAALHELCAYCGERADLRYCVTKEEALNQADALLILTEWEEFFYPDWFLMKTLMKSPVIFDGRNLYDPDELSDQGISYHSLGRKQLHREALQEV